MTETVWMITRQRRAPDERVEFWYSPPGRSAKEAWDNYADWEAAQNGGWAGPRSRASVDRAKAEGWRARRVTLALAGRYSLRWYP